MHALAKDKPWCFGRRSLRGSEAVAGLGHSVVNAATNVHELNAPQSGLMVMHA
jgi:hypothetical protein